MDNARTAQELADELDWLIDSLASKARACGNASPLDIHATEAAAKSIVTTLRVLAALASQAEPVKGRLISSGPNAGRAIPPPAPAQAEQDDRFTVDVVLGLIGLEAEECREPDGTLSSDRFYAAWNRRQAEQSEDGIRADERERMALLMERQHTWITNIAAANLIRAVKE